MALVFGPHDEDGFLAARASLFERFGHWLVDEQQTPSDRATLMAGDAGLALDWKWS